MITLLGSTSFPAKLGPQVPRNTGDNPDAYVQTLFSLTAGKIYLPISPINQRLLKENHVRVIEKRRRRHQYDELLMMAILE